MELDNLLGVNEVIAMVNRLSLTTGRKKGEPKAGVEEDAPHPTQRNNLDQLGPKTLRAQGSILTDTTNQVPPITFLVQNEIQREEDEKYEATSNKKYEATMEDTENSDMDLVEETPKEKQFQINNFND